MYKKSETERSLLSGHSFIAYPLSCLDARSALFDKAIVVD